LASTNTKSIAGYEGTGTLTHTMSREHGLLGMPESYGVKSHDLSDVVQFDGGARNPFTNQTSGAGVVLVAKICDALVNWGYGGEDVQKVGGLVARNLMTCESLQVGHEAGLDIDVEIDEEGRKMEDARRRVELMLEGLLEKDGRRSRSVTMNSNEPVVLINQSKRIGQAVFNGVVDETVTQLQQDWNIWPVRVYAGPYVAMPGDGFSITLLNVVNTDIGGPSMVQLLDAPCAAPE